MLDAVNNSPKQRGRPFAAGRSGNPKGRPKGSRNRRTRSLIEAAEAGGELPLDYMLRTMRDPAASAKRRAPLIGSRSICTKASLDLSQASPLPHRPLRLRAWRFDILGSYTKNPRLLLLRRAKNLSFLARVREK